MTGTTQSRIHFDKQLQKLREDVILLGSLSRKAVERSVEALRTRDVEQAQEIIDQDRRIDDMAYAMEEQALTLIATQQPMASDLRAIAAGLYIISELERIGDYAEGIAKITIMASQEPPIKPLIDIPRMALIAADMLDEGLQAFIDRDLAKLSEIWQRDDELDALYNQVYRELLTYMINDPSTIERATQLLWASHNLERIGDRVTNICERGAFVITGDPRALPGKAD